MDIKILFDILDQLHIGCLVINKDDGLILDSNGYGNQILSENDIKNPSVFKLIETNNETLYDVNNKVNKYIRIISLRGIWNDNKGQSLIALVDISDNIVRKAFEISANYVGEGMALYDAKQRLMFMNDSAVLVQKLNGVDVVGKTLQELFPDGQRPYATEEVLETGVPVTGKSVAYTTVNNKKNLSTVDAFPIHVDGKLIGAVCTEENSPLYEKIIKDNINLFT